MNFGVRGVEGERPVHFPGDVGKLQHGDRDVAHRHRSVQLIALANGGDEVGEVEIGHRVAANCVGRVCSLGGLYFRGLVALEIVDLVTAAVHNHRASSAHDAGTAVASVELHSLAAFSLPFDQLVFVFKAGEQRVVELPIILEVIAPAGGGDALRIVDAESPAANIHFMGAVVQSFTGAPDLEPVPVIGLHVVFVGLARRGALPQVPIEVGGHGRFLADADGFADVAVPGFGIIGPADKTTADFVDNLDGVRG